MVLQDIDINPPTTSSKLYTASIRPTWTVLWYSPVLPLRYPPQTVLSIPFKNITFKPSLPPKFIMSVSPPKPSHQFVSYLSYSYAIPTMLPKSPPRPHNQQ